MPEQIEHPESNKDDEVKPVVLENIQQILEHERVQKIIFVDDAINQDTGLETFKGIINEIVDAGKIQELREIQLVGIDFNKDAAILNEHIDEAWSKLKHKKQLKYFEKAYIILGKPDAIRDLNVSNYLKDYFGSDQIVFMTPNEWDELHEGLLAGVEDGNKIIVLFDQDLKLANGRFEDQLIQGEQLIAELKQKDISNKAIISLLTHTTTACDQELPKRKEICDKIVTLTASDFFVLAKVRLENPPLFADGLKKVCLNTYCESIKDETIKILEEAQKNTIEELKKFDTYDFDCTVFKSSHFEGVWEPETLLRITDIIFKDEVRKLMISNNYVPTTNPTICRASELSKIEFKIENHVQPYTERFKLRHQEIYESGNLINSLRKPIENGDIFIINHGEKMGKKFILVAQDCDLMVRGEDGNRSVRTAVLLEIEVFSDEQFTKEITKKYEKDIQKGKFNNHYFSDRYKIDYFELGTNKVGIVYFDKPIIMDLYVSDLIVFQETGEATLDFGNVSFNENYHNSAWKKRYDIIYNEFMTQKASIEQYYSAIDIVDDPALKIAMQAKFNYLFSFIHKAGIQINYDANKFSFGFKRILRLRQPKSKILLDKYYQYLSRPAELHDFV